MLNYVSCIYHISFHIFPNIAQFHLLLKSDLCLFLVAFSSDNGQSKVPGDWYFQEKACRFDPNL